MSILLILLALLFMGIMGVYAWMIFKLGKEEYLDYPIVWNFMSNFSGGYAEGVLVNIDPHPVRPGFIIRPKDIDYLRRKSRGEDMDIKDVTVFANHWQTIPYPRGTLSSDRNIIVLLPPKPEDLPVNVRNTPLGQALMKTIGDRKAEQTAVDVIRQERVLEDMLLHRTEGKDRVREFLTTDKALTKDLLKKWDLRDNKSTTGVSLNPTGGGI